QNIYSNYGIVMTLLYRISEVQDPVNQVNCLLKKRSQKN
ncbi:MAG: hypothetical protein RL432_2336, partial [Bacteroidota bacterium]